MKKFRGISAVFFDMDGTLVDSEVFTAQSVTALCRELGVIDAGVDCSKLDGVSWDVVAQEIVEQMPQLAGIHGIPGRLHEIYQQLLMHESPPFINGARDAVIAASAVMPTAIVSSSYRESIAETIRRMQIESYVDVYTGAEDCIQSKPAPDGYLNAAEFLEIEATDCLVFEDSVAGIMAARSAGMPVVAVTQRSSNIEKVAGLADGTIADFCELEDHFFEVVHKQR